MNVNVPLPAIEADRLTKHYGEAVAVDAISFQIATGSVTGLLGGNGAGKTTTIGMIMSLVAPTSGRVSVLGFDMARDTYRVLHRMNFESPYVDLPHRLSVRQNLTVFGGLYGVKNVAERIARLAADLDLKDFVDRPSGKLSAGQKTRVALAKALINEPDILILDEPTASLDPDTADWIRGHLERIFAMVMRHWYLLRSSWPRLLCKASWRRSRNLANLMISPLRPIEFVLSMITMSVIRLVIGVVPVTILAMFFFGFNFWGLGFALGAFFANLLLTSWAIGLLCAGLVLRNGLGAEGLTWSIMFLFCR